MKIHIFTEIKGTVSTYNRQCNVFRHEMHVFLFDNKSRNWPGSVSFVKCSDLSTDSLFSTASEIPQSAFSINGLIPRVCDFDFMAIKDLRICKGFDRETHSGCNFTPSIIIHCQIPYKFSNLFSP